MLKIVGRALVTSSHVAKEVCGAGRNEHQRRRRSAHPSREMDLSEATDSTPLMGIEAGNEELKNEAISLDMTGGSERKILKYEPEKFITFRKINFCF